MHIEIFIFQRDILRNINYFVEIINFALTLNSYLTCLVAEISTFLHSILIVDSLLDYTQFVRSSYNILYYKVTRNSSVKFNLLWL